MKYIICAICMFFGGTSCSDFLDHPLTGAISDDNIGEIIAYNPEQLASFLGNANRMIAFIYGREIHMALGSLPHELDIDYISDEGRNQFCRNDATSANKFLASDYYQNYYTALLSVNVTLDLIDHVDLSELTESEANGVNNYKGEALFLRAFIHFDLLRLFGENGPNFGGSYPNNKDAKGIVLANSLATAENAFAARSTVEECYNSIIADLKQAEGCIGDNQIPDNTIVRTPGSSDNDYTEDTGWAQKPAVHALLGKVYLYMNDYTNAQGELTQVINDPRFSLDRPVNFTDYIQHSDNNPEIIYAFQYYDDDGTTDAYSQPPYHQINKIFTNVIGAWKNYFIDKRRAARFGDDPRIYEASLYDVTCLSWSDDDSAPVWNNADTDVSDFRYYPRKYIDFFDSSPRHTTKNVNMIRLADVYLMYAEVMLSLGNTGVATEYVNKVRRRAWNEADYDSPATKGEDLSTVVMETIQGERYKELFFEGHRWFDICRWGIVGEELAKYPTTRAGVVHYDDNDYYMPFPETELKSNPLLEQSLDY